MQCCVCLENIQQKTCITTVCKHKFHTDCLKKWKEKNKSCPMCRENLDFGDDILGMQDISDNDYNQLVSFFGLDNNICPQISLEDGSQFFTHIRT